MTRTTLNVSFYCRKSKEDKDGLAPVELVIIINGRWKFRSSLTPSAKIALTPENYFILPLSASE